MDGKCVAGVIWGMYLHLVFSGLGSATGLSTRGYMDGNPALSPCAGS